MTKRKYTYHEKYDAHYGKGFATIPDQVVHNLDDYENVAFPAINEKGVKVRVTLRIVKLNSETISLVVSAENRHLRHVERCPHCRQTIKS